MTPRESLTRTIHSPYDLAIAMQGRLEPNEWQRGAINNIFRRERTIHIEAPRRSGKTYLITKILEAIPEAHVIAQHHNDYLYYRRSIGSYRTHRMGELVTLLMERHQSPELILCDECSPEIQVGAIPTRKIISFGTPQHMESHGMNGLTTEQIWFDEIDSMRPDDTGYVGFSDLILGQEDTEKEWDNEEN